MYSQEISKPNSPQEGIQNFVQMIINQIEAGETREALLLAVDLKGDLASEIYKVTMDNEPVEDNIDTRDINKR